MSGVFAMGYLTLVTVELVSRMDGQIHYSGVELFWIESAEHLPIIIGLSGRIRVSIRNGFWLEQVWGAGRWRSWRCSISGGCGAVRRGI